MKILLTTLYDETCIGLRILASCLKNAGHDVYLCLLKEQRQTPVKKFPPQINSSHFLKVTTIGYLIALNDSNPITQVEDKLYLDYIKELQPDIIGISFRSILHSMVIDYIEKFKQIVPAAKIICGGYGPTLSPEIYTPLVDAVIRGEGEEAIVEVCNAFQHNRSIKDIANVSYEEKGKCINNPLRCPSKHVSEYPWPFNWHDGEGKIVGIDDNKIHYDDPLHYNWQAYIFLFGRGCLGSCSYCSGGNWIKQYKEAGFNVPLRRVRDIEDAIGELKRAKADGFKRVHFTDEYISTSVDVFKKFLDRYEEEINLPVHMNLYYEQIIKHPELLKQLKRIGLRYTPVGLQSGCEEFVRDIYNRKIPNKTILKFIDLAKSEDFIVNIHLIAGNPLETDEIFKKSLDFLKTIPFELGKDIAACHKLMVFPKSPLALKFPYLEKDITPVRVFEREGCLQILRMVMDDNEFNPLLENKDFIIDPTPLREIFLKTFNLFQNTKTEA